MKKNIPVRINMTSFAYSKIFVFTYFLFLVRFFFFSFLLNKGPESIFQDAGTLLALPTTKGYKFD